MPLISARKNLASSPLLVCISVPVSLLVCFHLKGCVGNHLILGDCPRIHMVKAFKPISAKLMYKTHMKHAQLSIKFHSPERGRKYNDMESARIKC